MASSMNLNMLSGNRATLEIDSLPDVSFSATEYSLPGVTIGKIETPTRFNPRFEADDRLMFDELEVTFLVDEDLANWKQVFNWMVSLGMPVEHSQYLEGRADRFSDAQMQVYSSHNNLIQKIAFREIFPVSLTGIDFSEREDETVYRTATARFSILYYEFV